MCWFKLVGCLWLFLLERAFCIRISFISCLPSKWSTQTVFNRSLSSFANFFLWIELFCSRTDSRLVLFFISVWSLCAHAIKSLFNFLFSRHMQLLFLNLEQVPCSSKFFIQARWILSVRIYSRVLRSISHWEIAMRWHWFLTLLQMFFLILHWQNKFY